MMTDDDDDNDDGDDDIHLGSSVLCARLCSGVLNI